MKNFTMTLTLSALLITTAFSQGNQKARYLNIDADKNVRTHTDQKLCESCSDENFVVDGDESLGYIELDFVDVNTYGIFSKAELIINIADVEWAESDQGFSVFYNDEKIGGISEVKRNALYALNLNVQEINKNKKIKLILKANGEDGLYILSKKSGFGAVLKLHY